MKVGSWGNFPGRESAVYHPQTVADVQWYAEHHRGYIARGNGRSYGDSALAGQLISGLGLNGIGVPDAHGTVVVGAGVLLSDLLERVVPRGWFLPVTPGTKFISIGGALAADIHGKNHHKEGTIGQHVLWLDLVLPDGTLTRCSPSSNKTLFYHTFGAMGLTGTIVAAAIQLKPIETAWMRQETHKAPNLQAAMEWFEASQDWTYSVAWLDTIRTGKHLGRSLLMRAEHAVQSELTGAASQQPLDWQTPGSVNIPFHFPGFTLNTASIRAFNWLYYHKQRAQITHTISPCESYFYPLDRLRNWNRIYGKRGFTQYQLVVPREAAKSALPEVLAQCSKHGQHSFLSVLKLFGAASAQSPLSFPMEGYTLTLDLRLNDRTRTLCNALDAVVNHHAGRVYLAKDVRMERPFFRSTYAGWETFAAARSEREGNENLQSDQSQRVGLTQPVEATRPEQPAKVLILGATSGIAEACARSFAKRGHSLILTARNTDDLKALKQSLESEYNVGVELAAFDSLKTEDHEAFYQQFKGLVTVVIAAFGVLEDESQARKDAARALAVIATNYVGTVSILNIISRDLKAQGSGTILGISSVAGERGRQSNYLYGSSKAGMTAYLDGLRNELASDGVHVCTVKPGFVATKMIDGLNPPPALTASPEQVAEAMYAKGFRGKRNTIYVKPIWRLIMLIIRSIPEPIFKRLKL